MGAGSPPGAAKPSAIPPHMLNGSSPLQSSTTAGTGARARDNRERESLNSSIKSSFAPRVPAEFEAIETNSSTDAQTTSAAATAAVNSESTLTLRYANSLMKHHGATATASPIMTDIS